MKVRVWKRAKNRENTVATNVLNLPYYDSNLEPLAIEMEGEPLDVEMETPEEDGTCYNPKLHQTCLPGIRPSHLTSFPSHY
jgi:hypothetical protein